MLKFKSILLLFAIQAWSFGQQFNFKKYGLEEGLPRVGVYDIFQDDYGFLWIGTEGGGVCKFDGKTFHSYTRKSGLASDNIRLLYQSKDKTLCVQRMKVFVILTEYHLLKLNSLIQMRLTEFVLYLKMSQEEYGLVQITA
ncbi:MAG: hypothetical protein IPM77_05025 [Crocinitomicaceae bacterium]|nr:hypothetical protein [Crocinitomicaceae bacterium]